MTSGEQRWREVAERVVGSGRLTGYDLEDFAVVNAGRRRIVRVVVDSDSGLGLDAAAEISRALSEAFDELDESLGGNQPPYTLEVTSPGIGRPLTQPRHFDRARGRLVTMTFTDGSSEPVRVLGTTTTGVDILGGKSGTTPDHVEFERIAKAKVEVEFSPPSAAVAAALGSDPRTSEVVARGRAEIAAAEAVDEVADDGDVDEEVDDEEPSHER